MTLKEAVKKYQGKYFLGYEISNDATYVFVKKVCRLNSVDNDTFITYSNVICSYGNYIEFEQNRRWFFGEYHINKYNYKEISKSKYLSVLKNNGFENPKKENKEYSSCLNFIK